MEREKKKRKKKVTDNRKWKKCPKRGFARSVVIEQNGRVVLDQPHNESNR